MIPYMQGIYLLATIIIILPGILYCTLGHGKLRANNNNTESDAFIAFDHAEMCLLCISWPIVMGDSDSGRPDEAIIIEGSRTRVA